MDYITFNVTESTQVKDRNFKEFDVRVLLSGQQLISAIFNAVEVVAAHECKFAEFDLFTCSCGVAGCAGFQSPVTQKIIGNKVHWIFPEEGDYKTEKLEYVFDKEQFFDAFQNLVELIENKESKNEYLVSNIDWMSIEESEEDFKSEKETFTLNEHLDYAKKKFKEEEDFQSFLNQTAPDLYESSFVITFQGEQYKYPLSLDWLVNSIMNYNKSEDTSEYQSEIVTAIKSIRESVDGSNLLLESLVKEYYEDMEDGFIKRWFYSYESEDGESKPVDFQKFSIKIVEKK